MNLNALKYFIELNLPDIYFDNLELQIRSNNQDLLEVLNQSMFHWLEESNLSILTSMITSLWASRW